MPSGATGPADGKSNVGEPLTAPAGPLLLTADETADLLRTTRRAVYAMAERGLLPGVTRIGRRLLVRRQVLLSWLDQKRTPSLEE